MIKLHRMSTPHSTDGATVLNTNLIELANPTQDNDYRQLISQLAWDALSPSDKQSLQKTARAIAGDDRDLDAAYCEAVLIVDYVHKRTNLVHTSSPDMLAPSEYRYWW